MLVINSIEKTRLSADSYSYSGTGVAWKARLVLFLGFALMAGGLAGSVVSRGSFDLYHGVKQREEGKNVTNGALCQSAGKLGRRRGLGVFGSTDITRSSWSGVLIGLI